MAFTSQSRLCFFLVFLHVFFFPSGAFLRTFVLAWFLQYFERLGAPEVCKETLRKSMFLTTCFFLPLGVLFADLHFGMVFTVLRALGGPRGPQRDPPKEHVSAPPCAYVRQRTL